MITINSKYKYLKPWLETIPRIFSTTGTVVYDYRNQIRFITSPDGTELCIKRFHKPSLANRLIYTFLRSPKARRAYTNSQELTKRGINTPEAVAYILEYRHGLLAESYLITLKSRLTHTFYEFRNGDIRGREDLIKAFAVYSAQAHLKGVWHYDYSPGNILYDKIDGKWEFEMVDINRMHIGKEISAEKGCSNFARLWGKTDFFEILAAEYARARNTDPGNCLRLILKARHRFWKNRPHDHFITDDSFTIGVIVSTPADEIIIADDGSDSRTRQLIDRYRTLLPIKHVWHEDQGFRKTAILNKAVQKAESDYLVFIDQDLIARNDFIGTHYRNAAKRRFISGGAILLPEELSYSITQEDIRSGRAFSMRWLLHNGMKPTWKMSKLTTSSVFSRIMNLLTPAKATWNGGNSSTWREYIIAAGGFDTRMRYGAEDREFGERLTNAGIKGRQLRYNLPLLHLWHTRPYRNETDIQRNKQIWQQTKRQHLTKTAYGMT